MFIDSNNYYFKGTANTDINSFQILIRNIFHNLGVIKTCNCGSLQLLQVTNLGSFSIPDSDKLLSNDRQHLDVDSVELVKAAPGSWLGEPGEEFPHHFIVETVRAVEHDTL